MLDKSIDGALLALRKSIIRGDGEGLGHVEALLAIRGVEMPRVLPAKRPDVAKRGHMQMMILEALRARPMTLKELTDHIHARTPDVPHRRLYFRLSQRLCKLKSKGLVSNAGGVWGLAP